MILKKNVFASIDHRYMIVREVNGENWTKDLDKVRIKLSTLNHLG